MMNLMVHVEFDVLKAIWAVLFALWLLLAFRTKRTVERRGGVMSAFIVCYLAIVISNTVVRHSWIHRVLWHRSSGLGLVALLLVACGATVAIWARFTIGTNWSGVVTLKEDHELVQAGPYRFVRHPIYSGILLMGLGTQIVYAEAFGFELLLFVSAVFAYKLRIEEDLMTEQFPSQYKEYRRHVKAIIPFLW